MQIRTSMSGALWYSVDGKHWYASWQAAALAAYQAEKDAR
jgi:hypothetical protein